MAGNYSFIEEEKPQAPKPAPAEYPNGIPGMQGAPSKVASNPPTRGYTYCHELDRYVHDSEATKLLKTAKASLDAVCRLLDQKSTTSHWARKWRDEMSHILERRAAHAWMDEA